MAEGYQPGSVVYGEPGAAFQLDQSANKEVGDIERMFQTLDRAVERLESASAKLRAKVDPVVRFGPEIQGDIPVPTEDGLSSVGARIQSYAWRLTVESHRIEDAAAAVQL